MDCDVVATVVNSSLVASVQSGFPVATVICPQGTQGPAGATTEWRTGSGAPAGALGVVGDFYIDLVTGDFYKKTGSVTWTLQGNFGTFFAFSGLPDLPLADISLTDQLLIRDTSAALNKRTDASSIVRMKKGTRMFELISDFVGAVLSSFFTATSSGSGASTQPGTYGINATEKAIGVWELDTGNNASGRTSISTSTSALIAGLAELYCCWRVAVDTLSTGLETFTLYAGFGDNEAAGDGVDGIFFRYTHGVFGGDWQCVCRANSVETVVDSNVPLGLNYQKLEIFINEAGTSATFYIDDALVATIGTNIPNTPGREFGVVAKIQKSVGNTVRMLYLDYFQFNVTYSGER